MPPAACSEPAAVITAAILSMTSTGGSAGRAPNTKESNATPRPPIIPSPRPPKRAPMRIIARTTTSSTQNTAPSQVTSSDCAQEHSSDTSPNRGGA